MNETLVRVNYTAVESIDNETMRHDSVLGLSGKVLVAGEL